MVLALSLTETEEAKLLARAQAEGITPETLVRQAISPVIDGMPHNSHCGQKPKKSMLGMLARYGPAPSVEEIDENRKEMFSNFGRDDIA
jgi:hypothetical protein